MYIYIYILGIPAQPPKPCTWLPPPKPVVPRLLLHLQLLHLLRVSLRLRGGGRGLALHRRPGAPQLRHRPGDARSEVSGPMAPRDPSILLGGTMKGIPWWKKNIRFVGCLRGNHFETMGNKPWFKLVFARELPVWSCQSGSWQLQGNHHSRESEQWCEMEFVHPQ